MVFSLTQTLLLWVFLAGLAVARVFFFKDCVVVVVARDGCLDGWYLCVVVVVVVVACAQCGIYYCCWVRGTPSFSFMYVPIYIKPGIFWSLKLCNLYTTNSWWYICVCTTYCCSFAAYELYCEVYIKHVWMGNIHGIYI